MAFPIGLFGPWLIKKSEPSPRLLWASFSELMESDYSIEFSAFKLKQGCLVPGGTLCATQSFIFAILMLDVGWNGVSTTLRLGIVFQCLAVMTAWVYFCLASQELKVFVEGRRIVLLCGNAALLTQAVSEAILLLCWVMTDECSNGEGIDYQNCTHHYPSQRLLVEVVVIFVLSAIAMPVLLPCHSVSMCFLSLGVSLSALLLSAVISRVPIVSICALVLVSAVMLSVIYTFERMLFALFNSVEVDVSAPQKVTVRSNSKEYLGGVDTDEMQHMIGRALCCVVLCYFFELHLFLSFLRKRGPRPSHTPASISVGD